jgi:ATP-dependent DNA ligase
VKYEGYRLRLERDGNRVRLITRGGYNSADRYPSIIEAALKNRPQQFVIDDEAVVLGVDGIADFNALHSRRQDEEANSTPSTSWRSTARICDRCRCRCARPISPGLLARRPDGIFVAPFEQGEISPDLFRAACDMGLEGMVSKRADRPYRAGRSKDWMKVKNREHPAYRRVQDRF